MIGWCNCAEVFGTARVYGNAKIFDHATIRGGSLVYGNARVFGDAVISNSEIFNHAKIYGDTTVDSESKVFGDTQISEGNITNAIVRDKKDYISISGLGSEARTLTVTFNPELKFATGCFRGNEKDFLVAVTSKYGEDHEYHDTIAYVKAIAKRRLSYE